VKGKRAGCAWDGRTESLFQLPQEHIPSSPVIGRAIRFHGAGVREQSRALHLPINHVIAEAFPSPQLDPCTAPAHFPGMTTTISVTPGGQLVVPKTFCQRKKIKPGSSVRITEVGDGFYVAPVPEPGERELVNVLAAAGSLRQEQSAAEEAMVDRVVAEYRTGKRRKKA